jgi:hypothetical protein
MNRTIVIGLVVFVTVVLPAAAQGNIASFSDTTGNHVFYVSNDRSGINGGNIHEFSLIGGQSVDTDVTRLANTSWAGFGTITAFSNSNGQHVFYIGGTDYHVHQLYWSFSRSSESGLDWTKLAGTAPPALASPLTGFSNARGEHVYYTAWNSATQNSHVHHLFASGFGKPIDEDLTVKARPDSNCASPNSMLTSFADGTTELVYYVGPTGHICEMALYLGVEGSYDLTGAALAMTGSPLTGFADASGQNEFYLGTNQHVYMLRLSPTGVWTNPDLTAQLGGMPAVPDSLTSFSNIKGQHVYYVDSNQHVNQINVTTSTLLDLTALYGGGGATAMPLNRSECQWGTSLSSISNDTGGGEDVYYIGTDQHVYQLRFYYPDGNVWYNGDQTALHHGALAGEQGFPLGWCLIS